MYDLLSSKGYTVVLIVAITYLLGMLILITRLPWIFQIIYGCLIVLYAIITVSCFIKQRKLKKDNQ